MPTSYLLKRFMILATIVLVMASSVFGQSLEDGKRLLEEGNQLWDNARSDQQFREAVAKFEQALSIFESLKEPVGISETATSIGFIYRRWGNFGKALEYFERALAVSRRTGDKEGEAVALNNMALTLNDMGIYNKAEESALKSITISRQTNDEKGEAIARHILGNIYYFQGDYLGAIQAFRQAQEYYLSKNETYQLAIIHNNLGDAYTKAGWYPQALESLEMALRQLKQSRVEIEGSTFYSNIGVVFENMGALAKAEEYYKLALEHIRKFNNPAVEREVLINLGNLARHQNDLSKAIKYYQDCVNLCQRHKMPDGLPKDMMANVYLDSYEIAKAEPLVAESGYSRTMARLCLVRSDYGKAADYYEKTVKLAEQKLDYNDLFLGFTGLGTVSEKLGQYDRAADFYRKAIDSTEEIRSSLSTGLDRDNFFSVRIGGFRRIDPYKGLARVLIKLNRQEEALKWSEYSKARLFAESFSRRSGTSVSSVPEQVLQLDRKLNDELAAVKARRKEAYEKNNHDVIKRLDSQIDHVSRQLRDHKKILRQRYPLYSAARYPEPAEISESLIKPNEWIISYDVSESGFIIYLLNGRRIIKARFVTLNHDTLSRSVKTILDSLNISELKDFRSKEFDPVKVNALSELLIGDVIKDVPENVHVMIIPDDCLQALPFELLLLNPDARLNLNANFPFLENASFFSDRNPISYSQSITAITMGRSIKVDRGSAKRVLVMADPVFDRKQIRSKDRMSLMATVEEAEDACLPAERLKETAKLARNLQQLYAGNIDSYEGINASKKTLLDRIGPRLADYWSIIFATHGYYAPDNPYIKEPVLLLSMLPRCVDGYLYQSEILALKVNADVVALTACKTGTGKTVPGEGTMSLGRAFQFAGAKSTLMSLWNVHEHASVNLVENFFRHLAQGKNRLQALTESRREIRDAGYRHPYFWSSFILVGEIE